MNHLIAAWPTLAAFVAASLVLAVTPGPGVVYIVSRTLVQGLRAGLASVAGVALGNLGNAIGASIGLAALFAVSSLAFTLVKLAGAGYLVWLGIKALRAERLPVAAASFETPQLGRAFRDGFVVALLNPKTALFFAAFLPQFIDPGGSAIVQSLAFGSLFVAIAASTDAAYAWMAGSASPTLARIGVECNWTRFLGAGVYFGLAAFTLVFSARAAPKT